MIKEIVGKLLDDQIVILYNRIQTCAFKLNKSLSDEVVCLEWLDVLVQQHKQLLDLGSLKAGLKSQEGAAKERDLLRVYGQISLLRQK